jgi:hypothetical protein
MVAPDLPSRNRKGGTRGDSRVSLRTKQTACPTERSLARFAGPQSAWERLAEGMRPFPPKMQRSRFCRLLARPVSQGDVDGRIIFNGFATAKNFSDWILNLSGGSRQVKMKPKKSGRILLKLIRLQKSHFSTLRAHLLKHPPFNPSRLYVNGTKLAPLAVLLAA